MGKLNATLLRYLELEDMRILASIEAGMKNHELVSAALAKSQSGGSIKRLKELCKNRLLSYERGKKYDGYRLTNLGYDYLALGELTKKNVIVSFGNQIGVGKESNIYTVANEEQEQLCLKLHRLGRVCFRKVTEKRDYHKHAKSLSWLYLSKLSATKEFAYMKALYDEGFPVPKPISFNRHCVVMELVQGTLLNQILELKDVEKLYEQLMNLILQFASAGLIHGDYNEFNIMITEEEDPVIIDFPQMLSTEHSDAEMYFNRDVECIKTFFKRRFRYESELYPKFSDIDRVCFLDTKVQCTGFTREMAKSLDIELGLEDESSEENEEENDVENIRDCEDNDVQNIIDCGDNDEENIEDDEDINKKLSNINLNEFENQASCSQVGTGYQNEFNSEKNRDDISIQGTVSPDGSFLADDTYSVTSVVSRDEIKRRIKKQHRAKKTKEIRKRCFAKGEDSAVRRNRISNAYHIKSCRDFWGI